MKEYIKKSIETEFGANAECWIVTGIWLDVSANCGVITLAGYKDFEAKEAGKPSMGSKTISINDLQNFPNYSDARPEVLTVIMTSYDFTGATLEEVE